MDLSTNSTCAFQDNKTALHLACERGHLQVVQSLVGHGADVNCSDTVSSL